MALTPYLITGICLLSFIIAIFIVLAYNNVIPLGFTMPTYAATQHMVYGFTYPEDVKIPGRDPLIQSSEWAKSYDVAKKSGSITTKGGLSKLPVVLNPQVEEEPKEEPIIKKDTPNEELTVKKDTENEEPKDILPPKIKITPHTKKPSSYITPVIPYNKPSSYMKPVTTPYTKPSPFIKPFIVNRNTVKIPTPISVYARPAISEPIKKRPNFFPVTVSKRASSLRNNVINVYGKSAKPLTALTQLSDLSTDNVPSYKYSGLIYTLPLTFTLNNNVSDILPLQYNEIKDTKLKYKNNYSVQPLRSLIYSQIIDIIPVVRLKNNIRNSNQI